MLLLLSIAFDLSNYFWQQQRAQRVVDDAALYGYRFLPRSEAASAAVRKFLATQGMDGANDLVVEVGGGGESLTIEYLKGVPLTFARGAAFLLGADGLEEIALPVKAVASVRGTPFDAVVAMDVSGYLAPRVTVPGDPIVPCSFESWGSAHEGAALDVFGAFPVRCNNQNAPAAAVVERCFNPRLTAIKITALSILEHFSASRLNAVGALVYPGIPAQSQDSNWSGPPDSGATESLRATQQAQVVRTSDPAVRFSGYTDRFGSNEACQAVVQRGQYFSALSYRYPGREPMVPRELVSTSDSGGLPSFRDWNVTDLVSSVSLEESVWAQVARESYTPNLRDLLQTVRTQMLLGGVQGEARGGMTGREAKAIFIVAGDLPYQDGVRFGEGEFVASALRSELSSLATAARERQFDLRLYYIVVEHQDHQVPDLDANINAMRTLLSSVAFRDSTEGAAGARFDGTAFVLKVSGAVRDDVERSMNDLLSGLLLERKGAVLAF
jgi:hypothetical protein